jgi:hypothetical protein
MIGLIFVASVVVLELLLGRAERREGNAAGLSKAANASDQLVTGGSLERLGKALEEYGRGRYPKPAADNPATQEMPDLSGRK